MTKPRRPSPAPDPTVTPQLRHPGIVLGPRANRTIGRIVDATRQIFLVRGYGGTTIDEIAKVAGVSRGSFYTYFPSKRDVLLTLGTNSADAADQLIEALAKLAPRWQLEDLEGWVRRYFELLDEHGSFAFAWTQAAQEDEDLRSAGMKGHLQLCRRMGRAMASLGDTPVDDPVALGLTAFSMLERGWQYCQLYPDKVSVPRVHRSIARVLAAAVR